MCVRERETLRVCVFNFTSVHLSDDIRLCVCVCVRETLHVCERETLHVCVCV